MTHHLLEALKKAVFARRPIIKDIFNSYGTTSLYAYAQKYRETPVPSNPERAQEFISTVREATSALLGEDRATSVAKQLEHYYYISTADHHGPLTHPFFLHSNLLAGAAVSSAPDEYHKNIIVLACSNVSLNNSSLPRSLIFNGQQPQKEFERLNLFTEKDKLTPVYTAHSFGVQDVDRMKRCVVASAQNETYALAIAEKLNTIIDTVYNQERVLSAKSFSDQITLTNAELWNGIGVQTSMQLPNLVYLSLESIVAKLLVTHHMHAQTQLHAFLFDQTLHEAIERIFDGIPGAFTMHKRKGTFLFWYISKAEHMRVPLWRSGSSLVSADSKVRIALEPEKIKQLLIDQELIPSNMLCLAAIACYYGVKCLGGFSQVYYLPQIEKAWGSLFAEQSHDAQGQVDLGGLCGDFVIAYGKRQEEFLPATGLDFILYGNEDSGPAFNKGIRDITVEEGLVPVFPELYRMLYGAEEREKQIAEVTFADSLTALEMEKKITPTLII